MQVSVTRSALASTPVAAAGRPSRRSIAVRAYSRDSDSLLHKVTAAGLAAVLVAGNVAPALAVDEAALLEELLASKNVKVLKGAQKVEAPSYGEVRKLVGPAAKAPAKKAAKKEAPKPAAKAPKPAAKPAKPAAKPAPKSNASSGFKLSNGPVTKGTQGDVPGGFQLTPKGATPAPAPAKPAPAKPAPRAFAPKPAAKPAPAPATPKPTDRAKQAAAAAAAAAAASAAFKASQAAPAPPPAPAPAQEARPFFLEKKEAPAAGAAPAPAASSVAAAGLSLADPAVQAGAVVAAELLGVVAATSLVGSLLSNKAAASKAPAKKTVRA